MLRTGLGADLDLVGGSSYSPSIEHQFEENECVDSRSSRDNPHLRHVEAREYLRTLRAAISAGPIMS